MICGWCLRDGPTSAIFVKGKAPLEVCEGCRMKVHPPSRDSVNPMVRTFGEGPPGETCKSCKLLVAKVYANRYLKCKLRANTNGPATDHRAGWPACSKFERREGKNPEDIGW